MVVLSAIGKFFVKIGRWIKETAWVQPLLIVGGVFIIIFSITPISNWVSSWFNSGDAAAAYYGNSAFKKSLVGSKDNNSEADKLFDYIENHSAASQKDNQKKYGNKFFVALVENKCSACESCYKGFETLQNKWSSLVKDGSEFKLHTLFVDTVDEDDDTINYFTDYFWGRHCDFFEEASTATENTPYYVHKVGTEGASSSYATSLQNLSGKATDNKAPIFFLIDFNKQDLTNDFGITCTMFTFANDSECGSSSVDKANYLADCWNYKGVFAKSE